MIQLLSDNEIFCVVIATFVGVLVGNGIIVRFWFQAACLAKMHSKAFIFLLVFVVSWICLHDRKVEGMRESCLRPTRYSCFDPKSWLFSGRWGCSFNDLERRSWIWNHITLQWLNFYFEKACFLSVQVLITAKLTTWLHHEPVRGIRLCDSVPFWSVR